MVDEKGAQLVELALVVALVAILSFNAVLPRSLSGGIPRRAARKIVRILDAQALIAIERGEKRVVRFSDNQKSIIAAGRTYPLRQNLRILSPQFGNLQGETRLVLRPDGSATPGRVTITNQNAQSCVIFQALRGRRRVTCD